MEAFTVLGLVIFLFAGMVTMSVLANIVFKIELVDERSCLGFIFVMLILSVVLSLFFTHPENFGYEKIVSNNSVEQEAMRND